MQKAQGQRYEDNHEGQGKGNYGDKDGGKCAQPVIKKDYKLTTMENYRKIFNTLDDTTYKYDELMLKVYQ